MTEISAAQVFAVEVSGEVAGVTSYGLVTVNTLASTTTLFADVSAVGGTVFDLNNVSGMPLVGDAASRHWYLLQDVVKPSWVTLTESGQVSLSPSFSDEQASIILRETAIVGGQAQEKIIRVICEPVKFSTSVLADLSSISVASPFSFQLSPLVSGLGANPTWAVAGGQTASVLNGLLLTSQGTLTVTGSASAAMGRVVYFEANNGSGLRRVGSVTFDLVSPQYVQGPLVAVAGQSDISYNLNSVPSSVVGFTLPGNAASRTWSFVNGQAIPSWLTLSSNGTLSTAPSALTTAGTRDFLTQVTSGGSISYGKFSLNTVTYQGVVSLSVVRELAVGTQFDLNQQSGIPLSGLASGRVWQPVDGQILPSWASLVSNGTLTLRPLASDSATTFYLKESGTNGSGVLQSNVIKVDVVPRLLSITGTLTANGQQAQPFAYRINTDGSPTSFSVIGLPAGLSLNTTTGSLTGSPSVSGTFSTTLQATDAAGLATSSLTLYILPAPPVITSGSSATSQVGFPFTYQITASGSPTVFGATGLPSGLGYDAATGSISGVPTTSGTASMTVSATNAGGTDSRNVALTILPPAPVVTSTLSMTAFTKRAFNYQITATQSPTSFSASGLPSGLSLNVDTGVISGSTLVPGQTTITIGATNSGGTATTSLSVNFLVPPPAVSSELTANAKVGDPFNYQITGDLAPFLFSASNLPAGLSVYPVSGLISGIPMTAGTFTSTIGATGASGRMTADLVINVAPATSAIGSNVTITENSEPSWLVSRSSMNVVGSVYNSSTAPTNSGGYNFAYWRLNGVRLADPVGRSLNPAKFTVTTGTVLTAVYVPSSQDSDADGILDSIELDFFGNLTQNKTSDSEGDGFSFALEALLGYSPALFDQVLESGLARRSSGVISVVVSPAFYPVLVVSDPSPIFPPSTILTSGTSQISLPIVATDIYGYRFTGWYSGGVRLDSAMMPQPAQVTVSGASTIIAKYVTVSSDVDLDGLADWYEWYNFGTLANNRFSDTDLDGVPVWIEQLLGFAPYVFDQVLEGGLARRSSAVLD
ncbi:MAG: putative Ig domain-containing protein, partial [Verrucomicrobiota bacterium]